MYRSPLAIGLTVVILILLGVGLAAWQFVSIKSTGIPLGQAARTPTHVFQLISTTERYLPKLHRAPGKDRFRIDLLVISISDPTHQQTFTLLRQQQANAMTPMTKILGSEGDVVWVQALDLFAVNLKTKRILRLSDLKKLNPELEMFLTSARFDFEGRLIAVSPDRQQAYAFPADSFKATPCPTPGRFEWRNPNPDPRDWLCAGVVFTPTEWFGALTSKDLTNQYKPGGWLSVDFPVNPKTETRQLYRGELIASDGRQRIPVLDRVSDVEYRDAAFLRDDRGRAALRLTSPDSLLLAYRSGLAPKESLHLARVIPGSTVHWTADTGIGRLLQILPGATAIAFIGERPPVPEKVSEPILVLVNTATGAITTHSLWR